MLVLGTVTQAHGILFMPFGPHCCCQSTSEFQSRCSRVKPIIIYRIEHAVVCVCARAQWDNAPFRIVAQLFAAGHNSDNWLIRYAF